MTQQGRRGEGPLAERHSDIVILGTPPCRIALLQIERRVDSRFDTQDDLRPTPFRMASID